MRRAHRPRAEPSPIGSVLAATPALTPPPDVAPPPVTRVAWHEAVGTRIAERAQPTRLDRGVLYVRVASAAWANELSLLAADIIAALRARGVALEALRFRVGRIEHALPLPAPELRRAAKPNPPLPPELRGPVEAIADEPLRAAVALAAARALSRKG